MRVCESDKKGGWRAKRRGSRELQDDVPQTIGAKPDALIDRRSADDKIDNSD